MKPKTLRQQEKITRALIKLHMNVKRGEFLRKAYWNNPVQNIQSNKLVIRLYDLDTQALALERVLRVLDCPPCLKLTLNATIKPLPFFPKIDLKGEVILKGNFYPSHMPF